MKIIGLGHKKNQGKDTFAKRLKQGIWFLTGQEFKIVSLSDVLFDTGHVLFGWAGMQDADYYNENYRMKDKLLDGVGATPRDIAKDLGDALRNRDPDGLIKATLDNTQVNVIITNIRTPNEAFFLRETGKLLKIERPGIKYDLDDRFDTALDGYKHWDDVIVNDGTEDHLREKAGAWISENRPWLTEGFIHHNAE